MLCSAIKKGRKRMSERHRQQEPAIQAESGRLLRSGKNIDSSPKGDFLLKKKKLFF